MGLVLLAAGLLAAVSAVLVALRMPGGGDPVAPAVRPVAPVTGDPRESTV